MRKSRSSHVKCDCGEKTHKCAHLKQTVEGHKDSCCCNHGGRCTCSHKKEPSLDTVPESDSDADNSSQQAAKPKAVTRRRRTNTAHSEPILSFDENGHHKPTQRHTKASQKSGPYTISRGSAMHRTGSASSLGTKSVDRSSRTTDSSSPDRMLSKSVEASPSIDGNSNSTFQQLNGRLPPLDLSNIQYPEYSSSFDLFSAGVSDYEPPMFSAGLSATSVDWAQYDGLDLKSGDNLTPSSFDQAQSSSYMGLDYIGGSGGSTEPTLTSNSGDVSETEDLASALGDSQFDNFPRGYFGGLSSSSILAHNGNNSTDLSALDFDQFKTTAAASKLLSTQSSFDESPVFPLVDDDSYWGINNFTDGITHSPDPVASGLWDTA
ncbi:uncharacterized protein F4822DRAFT_298894 [Hypoxylon trugodes]|uniref:uncharacterized protein n=1 Tax=Hypoxylon trugodes TaxID=326681 RepID=UPI0021921D02|nr:uncharacterized protein F4822DRAFT_298894 [Hypoxylon trugodes]KAI1387996.1 hypothetical protein F4822DRAFT_298894 [Hypoxylon trugodes]